jgi:hypothetical protein
MHAGMIVGLMDLMMYCLYGMVVAWDEFLNYLLCVDCDVIYLGVPQF